MIGNCILSARTNDKEHPCLRISVVKAQHPKSSAIQKLPAQFRPDYTNAACLALVSYRRQFKLENRASGCPGGYPNPTVMVFND